MTTDDRKAWRENGDRSLSFTVAFAPIPQPRPRFRAVAIPSKPGKWMAQLWKDPKHAVHLFKIRVLDAWRLVIPAPGWRFAGPLAVDIVFTMPRPQSLVWKTKPMPSFPDTRQNGDIDNLAKAVLDALNGKAWDDDRQVSTLRLQKWVASGSDQPNAHVTITAIESKSVDAEAPMLFNDEEGEMPF